MISADSLFFFKFPFLILYTPKTFYIFNFNRILKIVVNLILIANTNRIGKLYRTNGLMANDIFK